MASYQTHYYHNQRNRRLPDPKKPRSYRGPAKLLVILICLFVVGTIAKGVFAAGDPNHKSAAVVEAESKPAEPPKRAIDTSTLAASMTAITKQYPYNTSVAVVDLNSDTLIQTGDTYPFIAASTTKLLTALVYFSEVESGKKSLDDKVAGQPARAQMQLMINQSDNTAWKALNDDVTKESLVTYAQSHGVTSFDATDNKITSTDMAKLIAKLYQRKLINEEHTKLLLSWMQNTSEERFIPADVPEGIKVYHKAGYLEDRVHDVAIVDNGSAPFALVIYSKSYTKTYDYDRGQELYKKLTDQVVATFK